ARDRWITATGGSILRGCSLLLYMPGLYTNYLEKTGLVQPSFHPWAQPSLMEIWHSGSTTRVTPRHRTGPFLLSGQRGTGLTAWRIGYRIWTRIIAIQIMFW